MNRDQMIKKAATAAREHLDWSVEEAAFVPTMEDVARVMLGVFEEAHTPTDDEREALKKAIHYLIGAYRIRTPEKRDETIPAVIKVLRGLAAGFHRPVQGEPSGSAVLAALDAQYRETITQSSPYVPDEWGEHPGEWSTPQKNAMRAALRAAAAVEGGGR